MAQAQNVSANAVSGLQPLSYLNQNQPATVLFVRQKRSPTENDKNYKIGTIWLNTFLDKVYLLVSVKESKAIWSFLGAGTGGFPITPFVVGPSDEADFLTIQEAIDASRNSPNQNGTIYIQPGIYTENLIFFNKINLVSIVPTIVSAGDLAGVTIIGTHTPDIDGTMSITGCNLTGTTAIFESNAPGGASISLEECFCSVTDGFIFDLIDWTGDLTIKSCGNNSNSDGILNNLGGAALLVLEDSQLGQGNSRTLTTNSSTRIERTIIECKVELMEGNCFINYASFGRAVTFSGTSTVIALFSAFISGNADAITLTSSNPLSLFNCTIDADGGFLGIAGTGVVALNNVTFVTSTLTANTLLLSGDASIKANSFQTFIENQTRGLRLIETNMSAEGTASNIELNLVPKGSGDVFVKIGNLVVDTVGKGLEVKEGANARMGVATLIGPSVTVANTSITAATRIFLTRQATIGTNGILSVAALTPGVSFSITSTNGADNGIVAWMLVEPA